MWPFKKRGGSPAPDPPVTFVAKSGRAFFEYQCLYGYTDIRVGRGIVALVLDAQKEFGTSEPVKVKSDGIQSAILRVASSDGGFIVPAETSGRGDLLRPDDIVIWVPGKHMPQLGKVFNDSRSGWLGLIRAKVKPEFSVESNDFTQVCEYR